MTRIPRSALSRWGAKRKEMQRGYGRVQAVFRKRGVCNTVQEDWRL